MNSTNKRRSRRLRKKLRIGEFKELGFAIAVDLKPPITRDMEDSVVSAFLTEIVDPRSMVFGGWISDGFITRLGRGSVTEVDRAMTLSWLEARPEIETARVGPLVDAWYPTSKGQVLMRATKHSFCSKPLVSASQTVANVGCHGVAEIFKFR